MDVDLSAVLLHVTALLAPYFIVVIGAQAATESKDLGCYADSPTARRLELGVKGSPNNDRQVTQPPRVSQEK